MALIDVESQVTGKVWKLTCEEGEQIEKGAVLMILESMKMEIPVEADVAGKLVELLVGEEDQVADGDVVARIDTG